MKAAIIDDNQTDAERLKERSLAILDRYYRVTDFDIFPSAEDYRRSNRNYELYFIDCLLPDCVGTDLAKQIRADNPGACIIFTTAYMDYAIGGYEADALRYLLKPVTDHALEEALSVFAQKKKRSPVIELSGTARYSDFIPAEDIYYIESLQRKALVRLRDRSVESPKPLREFEKELPPEAFFRTSRHFLVNFAHIVKKTDNTLVMRSGEHVTISKRNIQSFNQAYIRFLKRG